MSSRAGTVGDYRDTAQTCFGTPEDWGLSKHKHAEVQAELSDHLDCLQADEGIPAVEEARASIEQPVTRRKLAGVHITDQVYATLNRLPTKQEWRELIFLLVCFALILISDWLAIQGNNVLAGYRTEAYWLPLQPAAWASWFVTGVWLLQGLAKAAFFTGLAYSLWRAWRLGTGVLLARVLQLKLIHTVLVVFAMLVVGKTLILNAPSMKVFVAPWSGWLTAPIISAAIICLALSLLACGYRRTWVWSLGLILAAVVLYPGGPAQVEELTVSRPILSESVWDADSQLVKAVASTDQAAIKERAELVRQANPGLIMDVAANRMYFTEYCLNPVSGMYLRRSGFGPIESRYQGRHKPIEEYEPMGKYTLTGPVVTSGGGLGWLALPIPLFGLIGFIGLALIMGRRGIVEFTAYTSICVLGVIATIRPFFYEIEPGNILELSTRGLIATPLPGFQYVLTGAEMELGWAIIVGGLVISAGIPWLLTSLFLRRDRTSGPDEQIAEGADPQIAGGSS